MHEGAIEPGIYDRHVVVLTLSLNKGFAQFPEEATYRDINRADDVAIIDILVISYDNFECLSPELASSVDGLWLMFKEIVKECTQNHVRIRTRSENA